MMDVTGIQALVAPPPIPRINPSKLPSEEPDATISPESARPAEGSGASRTAPPSVRPAPSTLVQPARLQGETGKAPAVAGPDKPPPHSRAVSRSTVLPRIVEAATVLRPHAVTRLRIALRPEPLGELLVDLALRGGQVCGSVLAGSEAAKDLILAHLDELRDGFAERGIEVGEFRVTVLAPFGAEAEESDPAPEEASTLRSLRRQVIDLTA